MKFKEITSGMAFTGAPVIITGLYVPGVDNDGTEFLRVRRGAEKYDFSLGGLEEIDVAEILESLAPSLPDVEPGEEPCRLIADWSELGNGHLFSLSVWNGAGEDSGEIGIYAFRGGLSRQNRRWLLADGTDIFAARFLNPAANIFLTTRRGPGVTVNESEAYPLLFFVKDDGTLRVTERVTDSYLEYPLETGGLYALDPDAVRKDFATASGMLPAVMEISIGGANATRLVIAREEPAPERYRLKFRNSFGAFEVMAVYGPLEITPSYDTDDATYREFDPTVGDFIGNRRRVALTETLTAMTGWLDRRETVPMFDLLGSEEVWLLDRGPVPQKVIPSISEVTYRGRPEAPVRFRLTLTPADSDLYVTPPMDDATGGIFTQEFNPQFN